jgi:predicted site-specific integrase-resolvase
MEKTVLPLLMREREAADRLSVSFRTLQTWRSRGGGPAFIRIAGAVR